MNSRDIELMEEVIEKLQNIDNTYENDIPQEIYRQNKRNMVRYEKRNRNSRR